MLNLENELFQAVEKAAETIQSKVTLEPRVGIILGTGLGKLAHKITSEAVIPYEKIPLFPQATAESHAGKLILGQLHGVPVVAMQGRFHFYEGYSFRQITFPVRVMKRLGINILVVSNACGGINPSYKPGDLMAIQDHINLLPGNPLIGPKDERLGPRYPDMSQPYSRRLIKIAKEKAASLNLTMHTGVYAAMTGPSLETAAEYKMLRTLGADVVGMSTVPETIVAVQSGLEVLGISVITDECVPEHLKPASLADIIRVADEAEPKFVSLIESLIGEI
jgi:purine-nucleoside phosphorylase